MLFILFLSVVFLQDIEALSVNATSGPVVNTNVGPIRGLRAEDGDYSMFMGIPYAEVNKSNVFGPSIPYPKFSSIFNAYDDTARCPQREEYNKTIVGTLDCLRLNIYVPNSASEDNRLPVLVWIYGGNFSFGFAGRFVFGPSYLVRHDVIFVTLNYRVGPYGFMCVGIPEINGNQGLKDQLIALRWVKANIAAFGGDHTRVTLGGSSAGASCVDYHLHYRKEDLFSRAIMQSGNVAGAYAYTERDDTVPLRIAKNLNYTTNDLKDAIAYLSRANTSDVIAAAKGINPIFFPCVEKSFKGFENYVTEHPINVEPDVKNIDILLGFSKDEWKGAAKQKMAAGVEIRVKNTLNDYFNFTNRLQYFEEVKEIVKNFYFDDTNNTEELRHQGERLVSDFDYFYPTLNSARKYLRLEVKTLFMYLFSYSGKRNYLKRLAKFTGEGVCHNDEIGYLFDVSFMKKPLDPQDEEIIDRITELWTNFLKYGNPTPKPTKIVPVHWPQYTQNTEQYLDIGKELSISSKPHRTNMAFVDLLYLMNEHSLKYKKEPQKSAGRNVVPDVITHLMSAVLLFALIVDYSYSCH